MGVIALNWREMATVAQASDVGRLTVRLLLHLPEEKWWNTARDRDLARFFCSSRKAARAELDREPIVRIPSRLLRESLVGVPHLVYRYQAEGEIPKLEGVRPTRNKAIGGTCPGTTVTICGKMYMNIYMTGCETTRFPWYNIYLVPEKYVLFEE